MCPQTPQKANFVRISTGHGSVGPSNFHGPITASKYHVTVALAGSYTNLKGGKWGGGEARRHVVGGIAQPPDGHRAEAARSNMSRWRHGHRSIAAQPLHGSRTGSVRLRSGGCGDCTATPLRLQDFHTIFAQPLYGFTPAKKGPACPQCPVQEIARCL